jgi:hypothetical protein
MGKSVAYTSYPLSASLTRRVVSYFNLYRLIIVLLLASAHFGGLLDGSAQGAFGTIASVVLAVYLLVAVFHLFDARRGEVNFFRLAASSLLPIFFSFPCWWCCLPVSTVVSGFCSFSPVPSRPYSCLCAPPCCWPQSPA